MSRYSKLTNEKQNGIVYTPKGMAQYLSKQMLSFYKESINHRLKILDPAIGDGELVVALISDLKGKGVSDISIFGFETESDVVENTRNRIETEFPDVSVNIYHRDFVEFMLEERGTVFDNYIDCDNFDFIIANPPYIRTQILGADKAQKLAQELNLTGRVDIYYVFMMLSLELLNENGISGFITSNRFMTIKAGAQVRKFFTQKTSVKKVIDFGDTHLFSASVLPCIIVFGQKTNTDEITTFTSVYEIKLPKTSIPAEGVFEIIDSAGTYTFPSGLSYSVKIGTLTESAETTAVWALKTDETTEWLSGVRRKQRKTFAELGKIRVGIKTTADPVFIGDDWEKRTPEKPPELLRPLITHRNAGQIVSNGADTWQVLYPHESKDGKKYAVDIELYPNSKEYLEKYRERLESRDYVRKANRHWYEIWVPQDPRSWTDRKIVFRDISEQPMFWIDHSGAVVNGDCYWIDIYPTTTDDEVMLALAVANSPFIAKFYDTKFNNKLYSGKRRYMSQYVEQFPIPDPTSEKAQDIIQLVKEIIDKKNPDSCHNAKARIDTLVSEIFSES